MAGLASQNQAPATLAVNLSKIPNATVEYHFAACERICEMSQLSGSRRRVLGSMRLIFWSSCNFLRRRVSHEDAALHWG